MGQQVAASVTWRGQNKPISPGSYETVGQQTRQTSELKPSMARNHMKNSKSRSETGSNTPSETEKKSSDFVAYGTAVNMFQVKKHVNSLRIQ